MAPPAILKARFFQRVSDNAWLARLDTSGPNPSMTVAPLCRGGLPRPGAVRDGQGAADDEHRQAAAAASTSTRPEHSPV